MIQKGRKDKTLQNGKSKVNITKQWKILFRSRWKRIEIRKKENEQWAVEKVHLKGHVKKQINQENLNNPNKLKCKYEQ